MAPRGLNTTLRAMLPFPDFLHLMNRAKRPVFPTSIGQLDENIRPTPIRRWVLIVLMNMVVMMSSSWVAHRHGLSVVHPQGASRLDDSHTLFTTDADVTDHHEGVLE